MADQPVIIAPKKFDPTTMVTLEEVFGEQTSTAILVLDAMDIACLKATSTGEIQRLQRLGRSKLKMLRTNAWARDNA